MYRSMYRSVGDNAPAMSTEEVPAGTIYTCPMHPEVSVDGVVVEGSSAVSDSIRARLRQRMAMQSNGSQPFNPGIVCTSQGPVNVSIALVNNNEPAICFVMRREARSVRYRAPEAVISRAGAVPRPKAAIVAAPRSASSCRVAMIITV